MTQKEPTTVLRFQTYVTPSPDDPKEADDFYRSLGMMMVAWGRLEGHFTLTLLNLMRIAGPKQVSHKLPLHFQVLAANWKKSFGFLSSPAFFKEAVFALVDEIELLGQERNRAVHAMWQGFAPGKSIGIATLGIKHQKGTANGLLADRKIITQASLDALTQQCNARNLELSLISVWLKQMDPTPKGARAI